MFELLHTSWAIRLWSPPCHAVPLPELSRRSAAKRLLSGPGEASRVLLAHHDAIMSYPLLFCLIHAVTMFLGQGPRGEIHREGRGRVGTSPLGAQTLMGKTQPWPQSLLGRRKPRPGIHLWCCPATSPVVTAPLASPLSGPAAWSPRT